MAFEDEDEKSFFDINLDVDSLQESAENVFHAKTQPVCNYSEQYGYIVSCKGVCTSANNP